MCILLLYVQKVALERHCQSIRFLFCLLSNRYIGRDEEMSPHYH